LENLAKRAMVNLKKNGVPKDVKNMAKQALDNLNGGSSGEDGSLQEMAKKALSKMETP